MLLNWEWFCPHPPTPPWLWRVFSYVRRHFWLSQLGRQGATGISWEEARGPAMHRTAPHSKEHPALNVNHVKIKKLWAYLRQSSKMLRFNQKVKKLGQRSPTSILCDMINLSLFLSKSYLTHKAKINSKDKSVILNWRTIQKLILHSALNRSYVSTRRHGWISEMLTMSQ